MKKILEISGVKEMSKKEQQNLQGGTPGGQGGTLRCTAYVIDPELPPGTGREVLYLCVTTYGESCNPNRFIAECVTS